MFFSLLGGVWIALWTVRAFGLHPLLLVLAAVASGLLLTFALRLYQQNKSALEAEANTPEKQRADRVFNIVNAGQWILILIVGNLLKSAGHTEWVLPAAMFIIGAHFLPLARVFHYPPHYLLGGVMMLWAGGFPFLSASGPSNPNGCLGAGLILWSSAVYALTVKPPAG